VSSIRELNARELAEFEPDLSSRFAKALFMQGEGQIDNRQLLKAFRHELEYRVNWISNACVEVAPYSVSVQNTKDEFSLVIDCRGLSAKNDLPALRRLEANLLLSQRPGHTLTTDSLYASRFPIYIVPRQNSKYLIGATSFESGDMRGVTVQSTFELLSAAVSLHSGFALAEIVELRSNRRPAFLDNNPRIVISLD